MKCGQRLLLVISFIAVTGSAAPCESPDLAVTLGNLRSTDAQIRLDAARNLPTTWQSATNLTLVVNRIVPFLSSSDEHVRLSVLATLEQICVVHPEEAPLIAKAKPALAKAAEDPLEDIRQYAIAVLGIAQGVPDEDLKRVLLRGFADPSHKVRRVALGVVSFKKFKDPEVVTSVLSLGSSRPDDLPRIAEALGNIAPTDQRAIALFVKSLDSNSADLRQQSLIALRKSGNAAAEAVPRLRQMASDPSESAQVKRLAKEVLNKVEHSGH